MRRQQDEKSIYIIAQAFYGNRTGTEIDVEDMDRFILGYLSDDISISEPIDRTIVRIPDTEDLVLVYNKFQEEKTRKQNARWEKEEGCHSRPLAEIPELDLVLYSRCIVCRMNADGSFDNLRKGDSDKFMKYLAR